MSTTLMVFSGVFVAWSGGFIMVWLYGTPWFLDFAVFGVNMRDLFQVHPMNLSVAVWVGFLALFGIATDDGVVIATYLKQSFARRLPGTASKVREAVVEAGKRRCRPCLMTSATTILALLPVLTSKGRGADVMIPMAIPSFGGRTVVLMTMFVVPTLFSALEERRLRRASQASARPRVQVFRCTGTWRRSPAISAGAPDPGARGSNVFRTLRSPSLLMGRGTRPWVPGILCDSYTQLPTLN